MPSLSEQINRLLPQTQCRECGYDGCAPYADALAAGTAEVNLCAPGGLQVIRDLAELLHVPVRKPVKTTPPALAWIDEAACIGCTACIRACPVDAIMGASKLMHTVIAAECTGCGLCLPPCPVDCIEMRLINEEYLPQNRYLAAEESEPRFAASGHAEARYRWHKERQSRDAKERKAYLAQREAATKSRLAADAAKPEAALNPAALIAQAMARAQAQQSQRIVPNNRDAFQQQQVKEAQERATYRRAQRDVKYGTPEEKAAAIEYLRAYKAEQEAKQQSS